MNISQNYQMKELTFQHINKKLISFFSVRPYISFGYLFGSRAKNNFTPLSDIDIAVFVNIEKAPQNLFELRLKELTALFHLFRTEDVDLVFLNEAPVELSYRILKQGILVFERDARLRVKFDEKIIRDYLDRKHFIDNRNKIIRQKMLEGSYFD